MTERFYGYAWLALAAAWVIDLSLRGDALSILPAVAAAFHGVLHLSYVEEPSRR